MRRFKIGVSLFAACLYFLSLNLYAAPGLLFNIKDSGQTASVDIILCLNGKGPLSCQHYHVNALTLAISTTIDSTYPIAGIKILTPGFEPTNCTYYPKTGYCLFGTSKKLPHIIVLNGGGKQNQAALTLSATPSTINYRDTSTLSVTGGSGTGAISYALVSGETNCAISGNTLTGVEVGTCMVIATKAADINYNAASSAPITITVDATRPGPPTAVNASPGNAQATITWTAPTNDGG
jgi:hypothetical protein